VNPVPRPEDHYRGVASPAPRTRRWRRDVVVGQKVLYIFGANRMSTIEHPKRSRLLRGVGSKVQIWGRENEKVLLADPFIFIQNDLNFERHVTVPLNSCRVRVRQSCKYCVSPSVARSGDAASRPSPKVGYSTGYVTYPSLSKRAKQSKTVSDVSECVNPNGPETRPETMMVQTATDTSRTSSLKSTFGDSRLSIPLHLVECSYNKLVGENL
jgi:hypothetical protein